jgi:hypothetical protein
LGKRFDSSIARLLALAASLCLAVPAAVAQTEDAAASPAATVSVAPAEVREVVAEGRAAIGETGLIGARKAAEAQALRNAVEKALGIYVSARTLTQNYTLVRDQVVTRSEGFATLKEVVRERVGPQEVRVTVRALVSLRPLAQQLKALNLTRAWRVRVTGKGPAAKGGGEVSALDRAAATLERTLADAGFVVVSDEKEADLVAQIAPNFRTVAEQAVNAGDLPMTMHSVRSDLTLRALRAGTGEVVAALSASDTALHISLNTARSEAADGAMEALAPRLADALMVLPASQSQSVMLVVSNLRSATQVGKLEDALNVLPGVRGITRRSYTAGIAKWELDVFSDATPMLARALEESAGLRHFGLAVAEENRSRIVAAARPQTGDSAGRADR